MAARQALEAEAARIRDRIADLEAELADIIGVAEASPPDDEHDVEGASVGFERARVTALLDAGRAQLAVVEAALASGDDASTTCEVCGGEIGDERLAALPATTRCVGCAGRDAVRRR